MDENSLFFRMKSKEKKFGPDYNKDKREDKSKPERQKGIGKYSEWEKSIQGIRYTKFYILQKTFSI